MPRQDFRRGDGLDGLAQPHIVADQRPAGPHREQRALGLIGIERRLSAATCSIGIGGAARKQPRQLCDPPLRVPPSRDEIERIVIGAKFVTGIRDQGHEGLESRRGARRPASRQARRRTERRRPRSPLSGNPFRRENARGVCLHCADTVRKTPADSPAQTPPWRRACFSSRASVNSMCLQVPSSLVA